MSGDVQPRKRKDKKKKRDDESSHGVHITKMGSDDVHLHVHEEHGTGGHWCAKIIFFSLMTILMGLVCLIILENRGLSDIDTPLSESRFSNYFDGWVDESRNDHDDHHDPHGSVEHDDHEEDDHNEPFEEEVDHSEGEEEELEEEEDENVTPEEEDDNITAEKDTAEELEDEDEEEDEDEDNATVEEEAEDDNVTTEDDNVTAEDDNLTAENEADDDNVTEEVTIEQTDDDEDDGNNTNEEEDNATTETSKPTSKGDDDPFDEEDDDGTFESVEKVVDNDAAELELLREKARQQAAAEAKNMPASVENDDEAENAPSWASSLAVKIGVGLALALVARLVLIRKNPISILKNPTKDEEPAPEILMKRRLTIATEEEVIPAEVEEIMQPLPEDDYSEEEIEIEEEIEYIEEDEEPVAEENQIDAGDNDYVPETFEQLNAMYRTKDYQEETEQNIASKPPPTTQAQAETSYSYQSPYSATMNNTNNNNNNNSSFNKSPPKESPSIQKTLYNTQNQTAKQPAIFEAPPPPPLVKSEIDVQPKYSPPKEDYTKPENSNLIKKQVTHDMDYEPDTRKEVTYDMDYQPDDEDIDYDEDDIYDDEGHDDDSEDLDDDDLLDDDEDVEEGEDASDIDDTELMNRLEAKYGKLPAKEYESDEDPDDPTWTRNY